MLLDVINDPAQKAIAISNDITVVKGWLTPLLITIIILFAGIIIQRVLIIYIKATG